MTVTKRDDRTGQKLTMIVIVLSIPVSRHAITFRANELDNEIATSI
jgi:hypothetical protein